MMVPASTSKTSVDFYTKLHGEIAQKAAVICFILLKRFNIISHGTEEIQYFPYLSDSEWTKGGDGPDLFMPYTQTWKWWRSKT